MCRWVWEVVFKWLRLLRSQPSSCSIAILAAAPSHVTAPTIAPASCISSRHCLTRFTHCSSAMPSTKKYHKGSFHLPFIHTATTTKAAFAYGSESLSSPAPISTKPSNLPVFHCICCLIDISPKIRVHTVWWLLDCFFALHLQCTKGLG